MKFLLNEVNQLRPYFQYKTVMIGPAKQLKYDLSPNIYLHK